MLPDDVIVEILKYVPSSLNICLVNKMFYETKRKDRIQTLIKLSNIDFDLVWLLRESSKIKSDGIRMWIRGHIMNLVCMKDNFGLLEELDEVNDHVYLNTIALGEKVNYNLLNAQLRSSFGHYTRSNREISKHCVGSKNMELLKWILDNEITMDPFVSVLAANLNWIEGLRMIMKYDGMFEWSPLTCKIALQVCDCEDIKWMLDNGCPMTKEDMEYAAYLLRIDVLEMVLYKDKYRDNEITMYILRAGGNEPLYRIQTMLSYAYEKYGWSDDAYNPLLAFYPLEMVEWALRHGCPFPKTEEFVERCVDYKRDDVIEMLYDEEFDMYFIANQYSDDLDQIHHFMKIINSFEINRKCRWVLKYGNHHDRNMLIKDLRDYQKQKVSYEVFEKYPGDYKVDKFTYYQLFSPYIRSRVVYPSESTRIQEARKSKNILRKTRF